MALSQAVMLHVNASERMGILLSKIRHTVSLDILAYMRVRFDYCINVNHHPLTPSYTHAKEKMQILCSSKGSCRHSKDHSTHPLDPAQPPPIFYRNRRADASTARDRGVRAQ